MLKQIDTKALMPTKHSESNSEQARQYEECRLKIINGHLAQIPQATDSEEIIRLWELGKRINEAIALPPTHKEFQEFHLLTPVKQADAYGSDYQLSQLEQYIQNYLQGSPLNAVALENFAQLNTAKYERIKEKCDAMAADCMEYGDIPFFIVPIMQISRTLGMTLRISSAIAINQKAPKDLPTLLQFIKDNTPHLKPPLDASETWPSKAILENIFLPLCMSPATIQLEPKHFSGEQATVIASIIAHFSVSFSDTGLIESRYILDLPDLQSHLQHLKGVVAAQSGATMHAPPCTPSPKKARPSEIAATLAAREEKSLDAQVTTLWQHYCSNSQQPPPQKRKGSTLTKGEDHRPAQHFSTSNDSLQESKARKKSSAPAVTHVLTQPEATPSQHFQHKEALTKRPKSKRRLPMTPSKKQPSAMPSGSCKLFSPPKAENSRRRKRLLPTPPGIKTLQNNQGECSI